MKTSVITSIFIFLFFLSGGKAKSANIISSGNYELAAGETKTIPISITNDQAFTAFQVDIIIPEHFSLANGTVMLAGRENGHDFSWELLSGNVLRLIAYSISEAAFTGSSGSVVQFNVTAGTKPGTYPLTLQNAVIASAGVNILDQIIQGNITLRAPEVTLITETINFGEIPLLQQSQRNITIQNTGNSPLTVSGLETTHPDYSLNETGGFVLSAGSSVSRVLTFYATEKGIKTGEVKVTSDCPANPVSTISLTTDAFAVNELHLGTVTGRSGYRVTLPVSINNMEPFTGFQFEIALPEQIKFIPGSGQLTGRKTDHQISADKVQDKLIVTAWSPTNSSFTGDDGEIGTLDFYPEGYGGYYNLSFSDAIIADVQATNILSASYGNNMRISAPSISLSSVSHDFGRVSVTDSSEYTLIINNYGDDTLKIQSISSTESCFSVSNESYPIVIPPYQTENISVKFKNNTEGIYSGRLIIRNNDVNNDPAYLNLQGETFEPNELQVMDGTGIRGVLSYLEIKMENYTEISAFQFDLQLPEGFTVVSDYCTLTKRSDGHSLAISNLSDNIVRFISYSGSLKTYSGNSGAVLIIGLMTEHAVPLGTYNMQLQNVVLSDINSRNVVSRVLDGKFELLDCTVYNTDLVTTCENELPFSWQGHICEASGIYTDTITSVNGCDSINVLILEILPLLTKVKDITVCESDLPYVWYGKSYDVTGTYKDTIPAATGCDTIVTLNLIIEPEVEPIFIQIGPLDQFSISPTLPTTSENGISGTWSDVIDTENSGSFEYVFTPDADECASPFSMWIEIIPMTSTILCPPDLAFECFADVPAAFTSIIDFIGAGGSIEGGCAIDSASFTMEENISGDFCPGKIIRTYSVLVSCGTKETIISCEQVIDIDDTEAPTYAGATGYPGRLKPIEIDSDIHLEDALYNNSGDIIADAGFTDNCGLDFDFWRNPDRRRISIADCIEVWEYTYEIRDLCGNDTTIKQQITIPSGDIRILFQPNSSRIACFEPEPYTFLEWRQSGGVLNNYNGVTMIYLPDKRDMNGTNCNGTILRYYRIKGPCDSLEWEETILLHDFKNPEFTLRPPRDTSECIPTPPYANYDAFVAAGGMAEDNCGLDESTFRHLPAEDIILQDICPQILVRTYEIFDNCGLRATFKDTLTIIDITPPLAEELPVPGPFDCYEDIPAPDITAVEALATDNCGGPVTAEFVSDSPDPGCEGEVIRTYRLTDICGNETFVEQIITVHDTTAPQMVCPPDLVEDATLEEMETLTGLPFTAAEQSISLADTTLLGISVSDNCEIDRITYKDNSTGVCSVVVTRTFTVYDGCNNSFSCEQIIELHKELPVSVELDVNFTQVCSGEEITFTASPVNEGNNPVYYWYVNGVEMAGETSETYSYVPGNGDKVHVELISSETCVANQTAVSETIEIAVVSELVVTVKIDADKTEICEGETVIFTAVSENGGSNPQYTWFVNGTEKEGEHADTFTYNPDDGDEVYVSLISDISCAINQDAVSNTIQIAVNEKLPVAVSITATQTEICINEPVTFTATPFNGGTDPEYVWFVNGVAVSGENSSTYTYPPEDGDEVYVELTSDETCVVNQTAVSETITINVVSELDVAVLIAADKTEVCEGDSVRFLAQPENGGINPVYHWYVNGVEIPGEQDEAYAYIPENGDEVYAKLISDVSCATNPEATSNVIQISVVDKLPVAVTIIADKTEICAGESVTFTTSSENEGSAPAYRWFVNGDERTGETGATFTYSPQNGDEVYAELTSSETCVADALALSDTIALVVSDQLQVRVSITADRTEVCQGDSVQFAAIPVNGGDNPHYRWFVNGIEVMQQTDSLFSYAPQNNDFVYVELTSSETCVANAIELSDTISIIVNEYITPEFDPIGPICQFNVPPNLPNASLNGVSGFWVPDNIVTSEPGIFDYIFTPESEFVCAFPFTMSIEIKPGIPEIVCPPTIETECLDIAFATPDEFLNAGGDYMSFWDADSLFLIAETATGESCPKTIKREYQIKNKNGDYSNSCIHQIIVDDQTNPRISCPPSITVDGNDDIPSRLTLDEFLAAGGTLFDNCGIDSSSFGLMSEFTDTLLTPNVLKRTYYIADECLNYNICLHKITLQDATPSSLIENTVDIWMNVFPNPNNGRFKLQYKWNKETEALLEIMNVSGKIVMKKKLSVSYSILSDDIIINSFSTGVYFIKLSDGKNELSKGFIVN